jgi:hypothetical protein
VQPLPTGALVAVGAGAVGDGKAVGEAKGIGVSVASARVGATGGDGDGVRVGIDRDPHPGALKSATASNIGARFVRKFCMLLLSRKKREFANVIIRQVSER